MGDNTQDQLDDTAAAGSVDAAEDTAADASSQDAANSAVQDPAEATGSEATSGTADHAEGAGADASEAAERKLPRQTATSQERPTNQNQPPKAGSRPAQPVDPLKALNDEKAQWGRREAQLKRDMEERDRKLEQFEREQQMRKAEADRLALKQWHPKHPESSKARARIERVKTALAMLDPNADQATKSASIRRAGITQEDLQFHDEYESHREETINRLAQDPEGFLDERMSQTVPQMIQQAFDQMFAHQRADAEVRQIMADPKKIAPHADFIREKLTAGSKLSDVMEVVDLRTRLAELEGKAGATAGRDEEVTRREKAAAERERLAKGSAAITRDQKTTGVPDFYAQTLKESKEHTNDKSWLPGGSRFNRHLAKLEEAHRTAADS